MKPIDYDDPDQPFPGLRDLREDAAPTSITPVVMQRILEPQALTFWQWLSRPHRLQVRLSPLSAVGALGGVVLVMVALATPGGSATSNAVAHRGQTEAPERGYAVDETVLVRFVLVAREAQKVAIAGDFNGWQAEQTVLQNADGRGTFVATIRLPKGQAYEYMFLVDGEWVTDPSAPETRPDGFGRQNALLRL